MRVTACDVTCILEIVKFSKTSIHHYQVLPRHRMTYEDKFFPIQTSITKQGLPTIQFLIVCSMEKWRGGEHFIM